MDARRSLAAFAEALEGEAFDSARAGEGGDLRVNSAERLRNAVLDALLKIHGLLHKEQRAALAYLIRTGLSAYS